MEGHQLVAQRPASGVPGGTNTEDIEAHNTNTRRQHEGALRRLRCSIKAWLAQYKLRRGVPGGANTEDMVVIRVRVMLLAFT